MITAHHVPTGADPRGADLGPVTAGVFLPNDEIFIPGAVAGDGRMATLAAKNHRDLEVGSKGATRSCIKELAEDLGFAGSAVLSGPNDEVLVVVCGIRVTRVVGHG